MLTRAMTPLESALKRLAKARGYKGLEARVTAVDAAATEAVAELVQIAPPAQLAEQHWRLVAALQTFRTDVSGFSSQVAGQAVCTGSAVRAGLGKADGTPALRRALAAVVAQLPDDRPTLTLPSPRYKGRWRPPNGKLIRAGNLSARGGLTIDNGGNDDAVVTLAKKGRSPAVSVYVRKDRKYTVKGVPDGSYTVFFTGGSDWERKTRAFGHDCAFQRFEDPMKFRTIRTTTEVRWTDFRITLQPVLGGNARTAAVDPNDFPDS